MYEYVNKELELELTTIHSKAVMHQTEGVLLTLYILIFQREHTVQSLI